MENTIWPPHLLACEVDKTRQGLLKQHYRKPLVRENIDTPPPPIEASVITTLSPWEITSHCLTSIRSRLTADEQQIMTERYTETFLDPHFYLGNVLSDLCRELISGMPDIGF